MPVTPTLKIKVWDWPTRLFHWLLVFSVSGAWISSFREYLLMEHVWFGHTVVGLLVFRIVWGWIGNGFARFREFVTGPQIVWEYAKMRFRNKAPRILGHNPLSAWMTVSLLLVLLGITLSGAVTLAGEEWIGPLAKYFSMEQGRFAKGIHVWLSYALLSLVTIHVLAAFLESFALRENLILAMISGFKRPPLEVETPLEKDKYSNGIKSVYPDVKLQYWFLSGFVLVVFALTVGVSFDYRTPLTQEALAEQQSPEHQLYMSECGSCHFGFHPSLLPHRSWEKMMSDLENHFGEDAWLDAETTQAILDYLGKNDAEHFQSEASFNLMENVADNELPLRITKIPYWLMKHEEISEQIYKRKSVRSPLNCGACHGYAEYGSFEDGHIRIPK
ncbi:MAG: cytochrome b/b6 domain-containing protein [SAR324 cluster bacterium]|nr:cytochrome b/b6 domain-containing protein [SAR324 cluster bacterium]MBL7034755.1 cytochrome b/b6 domain-containing protein [SAR324 cluster bacterium]